MAPNNKLYDSIEEETQVLIVNKNDDDGKSNHQSRFRPSMILSVLGIVALYCMVLAANRIGELEAELGRVHSEYKALTETVKIPASLMSSTGLATQPLKGHDEQCTDHSQCKSEYCVWRDAYCVGDEKTPAPTPPPTTRKPTPQPTKAGSGGAPCRRDSDCLTPEMFCARDVCQYPRANDSHCFADRQCLSGYCDVNFWCKPKVVNDVSVCSFKSDQSDYRGTINKTVNGRVCQAWSSQYPHKQGNTPQARPNAGLENKGLFANNSCRNPDGESKAWCYTQDRNVRWEYCNVPRC